MKKLFVVTMALILIGSTGISANAQSEKVVVLANTTDYSQAWGLVGFVQKNEIRLLRAVPENFEKYKNEKHIMVLVGPASKEGMEPFFEKVLTAEEQGFLKIPGNRKMYAKENLWTSGQKVIVFGFSDSSQIKNVLIENRRQWIENLIDWFDLEISWEELEY
jgi:hypothetical protein